MCRQGIGSGHLGSGIRRVHEVRSGELPASSYTTNWVNALLIVSTCEMPP